VIIFLSNVDWANVGYTFAKAVKIAGGDAEAFSLRPHPLNYTESSKVVGLAEIRKFVQAHCKTLVWMHSQMVIPPIDSVKKFAVFHGGSTYRNHTKKVNKRFNPIVDVSLTQTQDLLSRGAKNEKWFIPPVDTELLRPDYNTYKLRLFAHFPSGGRKGTVNIDAVMKDVQNHHRLSWKTSKRTLPWEQNIERMRKCDVYIETMRGGVDRLAWGVTALEAAALGKVVLANFKDPLQYESEFGVRCPILGNNTKEELEANVYKMLNATDSQLHSWRRDTRKWVEETHGMRPTGQRLLEILT